MDDDSVAEELTSCVREKLKGPSNTCIMEARRGAEWVVREDGDVVNSDRE